MSITSIRKPVSRSLGMAVIGIALDTFAWSITVSAAMTSDNASNDASGGTIAYSWLILVLVDLVACGTAVWLTKRAARDAQADIVVDLALFYARVSLIGVLGIALFMFAL
jgi:uncharacterized membrane protein YidH (DUF202 family)